MKKKNSRFSVNYILIGIVVILLVFLKRMDDRISELEKRETVVEKVELKTKESIKKPELKAKKSSPVKKKAMSKKKPLTTKKK